MSIQQQRRQQGARPGRFAGLRPPTRQLRLDRRSVRWRLLALAVVVAVGLGWLVTSPLRRPAERVYNPTVDAYVSTAHPDTNYAATPILRADATPKIRSYLRFRLNDLSGRVVRAELRLWSKTGDLTGYAVHRVASTSWDERGITSNNGPSMGNPVATSGPFGPESWSSTDVTRLLQANGQVSLAVTTESRQNITFDSREGRHRPQLVVQTRPAPAPAAADPATSGQWLKTAIENVSGATGARYGTRDDRGQPMETLKIISSPSGGYLGVYHTIVGDRATVRVATSTDLLHWRHRAVLDRRASQPTLAALSDGGFLVAAEAHADPGAGRRGRWLRFRYYPTLPEFLAGTALRTFDAPRRLATSPGGAEGTPNIYQATLSPDLARSTIQVGFHYYKDGTVDRQARGTLSGFSRWVAQPDPDLDAALERQRITDHIGDRDHVSYQGVGFTVVEGRAAATEPWRVYLYQPGERAAQVLNVKTERGSGAFANPTVTLLRGPSGASALVVTMFLPHSAAASGEAGELIYYKEYGPRPASPDPVIAAAGDIACASDEPVTPTTCRQQATSDLLVAANPTGVLALGDLQYEAGAQAGFVDSYERTWGRLKAITHPVPGNHEYGSGGAAGYFDYFGPAAGERRKGYYSFDLGAWHLIALNSSCKEVGGCGRGSPQERWLRADLAAHDNRCTLAYWHHPRLSSGSHGSNEEFDAFWRALYEAGADVVLNGHDHDYERFAPQDPGGKADPGRGIRQFVVGTGGKNLSGFHPVLANSEVRNGDAAGVLVLTLHPREYEWRFMPERIGGFTDGGSGSCN
jgi:hypothetical protein